MGSSSVKILFAGGGTGGHLFPALAIADEIKTLLPDAEILFVGTKRKIEARVVPGKGFAFRTIWISGFYRSFRLNNALFPLKVIVSLMQSFLIIKRFKPNVVVGTGGYVAGPVLFAAMSMGIPTVVHESNSIPGVTTKLLSRRASKVLVTFDATKQWLKRHDNVELVGNPTRSELGRVRREEGAKFFNLNFAKKTVLVFGGSLGAGSLNRAVQGVVQELIGQGIQLIWQTGERDYKKYSSEIQSQRIWLGAFIDRMEYAYAAADLVVCRAGATTLAELTRLGKPAVLVPYPHAAGNHQVINARTLENARAAVMVYDHEMQSKLKETILRLVNDDAARNEMSVHSLKLGNPDAGKEIAKLIVTLAH